MRLGSFLLMFGVFLVGSSARAIDLFGTAVPKAGDAGEQVVKNFSSHISELNARFPLGDEHLRIEVIEGTLPSGALARMIPVLGESDLIIRVTIDPAAYRDPGVCLEIFTHLKSLTQPGEGPIYLWYEQELNVQGGSARARAWLTGVVQKVLAGAVDEETQKKFDVSPSQVEARFRARRAAVEVQLAAETTAAKQETRARQKAWEVRRKPWKVNDPMAADLSALVSKNDRAGVAKILRERLPWELMETYEKSVWRSWISAIEKPDLAHSRIVFRGMLGDAVLQGTGGKYFFSRLLSRNRGSYLDRLRSFPRASAQNAKKLAGYTTLPDENGWMPSSLFGQMSAHASDPKGSPFLSFSNEKVAWKFARSGDGIANSDFYVGRIAAYRVDARLAMLNPMGMIREFEILLPLFVFPEDEIGFLEVPEKAPMTRKLEVKFLKEIEKRLARKLSPLEKQGPVDPEKAFAESMRGKAATVFRGESLAGLRNIERSIDELAAEIVPHDETTRAFESRCISQALRNGLGGS